MSKPRVTALLTAAALAVGSNSFATVIYETDFTDPFNPANLLFQDGWLGQNFTMVDPSGSGFANTASTTAFPRNLNNRGALGNLAGGAGGPGEIAGPGFSVGDQLTITAEYQFEIESRTNAQLAIVGVDSQFSSPGGGFNAQPEGGLELFYSDFSANNGGSLKVFGNTARNGFTGADNAFALFGTGFEIGLDPDGVNGPADLVSDVLEVSIEMTYLGADQWQTTALSLVNVDTATTLATAAADQPNILTEVQTIPSGNDLFLAVNWMRTSIPNAGFDSFRYEFVAGIPEPASVSLVLLGGLAFATRRR